MYRTRVCGHTCTWLTDLVTRFPAFTSSVCVVVDEDLDEVDDDADVFDQDVEELDAVDASDASSVLARLSAPRRDVGLDCDEVFDELDEVDEVDELDEVDAPDASDA